MQWFSASTLEPSLPDHCVPENDFLLHFSTTFHTCVPTTLAFTSNLLGTLSIVAWLFAQLPQIYKNWAIKSTSGLSIFFLVEWCLGDLSNLLGALFTHQASWQVLIGCYYVFVDLCLVGQWIWYEKLRHGHPVLRIWKTWNRSGGNDDDMGDQAAIIEGMPVEDEEDANHTSDIDMVQGEDGDAKKRDPSAPGSRPQIIFRAPTFAGDRIARQDEKPWLSLSSGNSNTIHRIGSGSSPAISSPSPRTMLLVACLIAIVRASPIHPHFTATVTTSTIHSTPLETAGTILSWLSTTLYLGSRLPQLYKNYRRKSTAGLSPHLFLAAFCGNLFYSSALLTNPCAWEDMGAYGGGGWVGKEGSSREDWVLAALPFFLGAAGVLGLDASVGVQFWVYGSGEQAVVVEDGNRYAPGQSRWRRVSGWMRGWVPSNSSSERKSGTVEREALLDGTGQEGERRGYGALRTG